MSAKGFSAVALFVAKFFRWKGNLRGATESPPSHVFLPQEITLPETNIAPENRQLEKEIPIENSPFSGASRPYLFRDYEAHHHAAKITPFCWLSKWHPKENEETCVWLVITLGPQNCGF